MRPYMVSYTRRTVLALLLALVLVFSGKAYGKDTPGLGRDLPLAAGFCASKVSTLMQADEPEKAVAELTAFRTRAAGMDPVTAEKRGYTHYYIDFLLGTCLMVLDGKQPDSDMVRRAATAFERVTDKRPDLSPAWLNLAQCRYRLEERASAARAFIRGYDTAEEKDPQHLYYAAACFYFAGQHQAALDTFSRLADVHPDAIRLEWKETPVNALFALDRNREALPWIKELARLNQGRKKKQWQEVLLHQYLALDMDDKALAYARFLTRSDAPEPRWWKSLAHIHLDKNRLEHGLQSLMIYGFLKPLSLKEKRLMADLFMACNIPLEAARYYEGWLEQAGAEADGGEDKKTDHISEQMRRAANAYRHGGLPGKALAWAEKGLAFRADAGLLRLKADLLFEAGKYTAACDTYGRLAELEPHQGVGSLMMGYAAWNGEQLETAATAFIRAAGFPKQRKAAQSALAQVRKIMARQAMDKDQDRNQDQDPGLQHAKKEPS